MSKKLLYFIIAILLISIVATGGFLFSTTSSVLSIDEVQLKSSTPWFNEKTWLITLVQGSGIAENVYGTVTPSDIESETGTATKESLSIDVNYDEQRCVYNIGGVNEPRVKEVGLCTWSCITGAFKGEDYFLEKLEEECGRGENAYGYYGKFSFSTTCYATYTKGLGYPVGSFTDTDVQSKFTITTQISGEVDSESFDTLEGSTQGFIGDDVYANWVGSLDTGQACPYTTDMPYRPAFIDGEWQVIDKTAYDEYLRVDSQFRSQSECLDFAYQTECGFADSEDELRDVIDKYNDNARDAMRDYSSVFDWGQERTAFEGGKAYKEVESARLRPKIKLYVKADTLGIRVKSPSVELLTHDSDCFATGEKGEITFAAQNTGGEAGSWNVYAQCDDEFTTSDATLSLDAGEVKTLSIPLRASTSKDVLGDCEVTLESATDTKTFSQEVCAKTHVVCEEGELRCSVANSEPVVKECVDSSGRFEIVNECDYACENGECVEKRNGNGDDDVNWTALIVIVSISLIISIFLGAEVFGFLPEFKGDQAVLIVLVAGFTIGLTILITMIVKSIMSFFTF